MMRVFLFSLLFVSVLFGSELKLTQKQADFIAKKVWLNEGAGLDKYLIHWNQGEDFASVGIGHFIWFSQGHTERFREVFPMVVAFMQQRGVVMPSWLHAKTPLPWKNKAEFYAEKKAKSKRYRELFTFLQSTKSHQAAFMAQRLDGALPQMLESLDDPQSQATVKRRFYEVMYDAHGAVSPQGLYALLDYTNFKGEGTLKSERYKGQGWGLLQVLLHMDDREPNRLKAFAQSARSMLSRRIKNSPPTRGEERWRRGWNVRLKSYWQ